MVVSITAEVAATVPTEAVAMALTEVAVMVLTGMVEDINSTEIKNGRAIRDGRSFLFQAHKLVHGLS